MRHIGTALAMAGLGRVARRCRAGSGLVAPGVAVAGIAALLSLWLGSVVDPAPPLLLSLGLGVAAANSGLLASRLGPGLAFTGSALLRAGVVLLGFDVALGDVWALGPQTLALVFGVVVCTYIGTGWLGRLLGVPAGLATLVAVGFSICGASAIAAARGLVDADEEEVTFSIVLVTLCGSLAIAALSVLRRPLGLDEHSYGVWVGASVHDVGQVVAAASIAGTTALATAVVVKLARVMLLAPLIAVVGARSEKRHSRHRLRASVPAFVVVFVAAVIFTSVVHPSDATVSVIDATRTVLLAAALFAIGARVSVRRFLRLGARPLALGLLSWLLIAGISFAGIEILDI